VAFLEEISFFRAAHEIELEGHIPRLIFGCPYVVPFQGHEVFYAPPLPLVFAEIVKRFFGQSFF